MSTEKNSFFDFRTVIAVLLMMFVWIGWESYLSKKYPGRNQRPQNPPSATQGSPAPSQITGQPKIEGAPTPAGVKNPESASEVREFVFDHPNIRFTLTSQGMGLKSVLLKKYVDRKNESVIIGANKGVLPFQTSIKGQTEPIQFRVTQTSPNEFIGVATLNQGTVTKSVRIDADKYLIQTSVEVRGQIAGVTTYLSEDVISSIDENVAGKNLVNDPNTWQSFYVAHAGTTDRNYTTVDTPLRAEYSKVSVASLGSRYFAMALVDESPVLPEFSTGLDSNSKVFFGAFTYPMLQGNSEIKANYKAFIGPKALDTLRSVDPKLDGLLDFGWFSGLGMFLLSLMKTLYGYLHNYGWSIVALTILVRIVVLPFNIMSYRSMKAMQVIQPQIQRIKEKYKDDREALNREMMNLMKTNKVNPLGGCLPMLLQLPVFFALYQVLDHAIELYRAPFVLWIHDLSLKDPYFVLPVLMGMTMFIQQKITPTTMDPAQARIMMFMPVIFTFFMISLPSGLTLYIFVSSLFGIIQQLVFMRDKSVQNKKPVRLEA